MGESVDKWLKTRRAVSSEPDKQKYKFGETGDITREFDERIDERNGESIKKWLKARLKVSSESSEKIDEYGENIDESVEKTKRHSKLLVGESGRWLGEKSKKEKLQNTEVSGIRWDCMAPWEPADWLKNG